jgi:hypothetical protein
MPVDSPQKLHCWSWNKHIHKNTPEAFASGVLCSLNGTGGTSHRYLPLLP